MECSYSIDCDVDGYVCFRLKDKIATAKKEHKCGECRRTISKGEKYRYEFSVVLGDTYVHKTCLDCNSVREALFGSFFYEQIWDMLRDEINNEDSIPESCMVLLTPKAREKVCDLIEEKWEDDED